MASYTFRWEHPAEEVYVTGTFDNWGKTIRLDKKDLIHEKKVDLPQSGDKILYKFVADGEWKHDHTVKTETDHLGNINNVLYPNDLQHISSTAPDISSVAPGATTTAMAGMQPLQSAQQSSQAPGASSAARTVEDGQSYSVAPIPASQGAGNPIHLAPGEKVPEPSTINSNTITSQVHDDPSLKSSAEDAEPAFSALPIPATGGIGNPVSLAPGEKVPDASALTSNTLTSNVKLDKESYERSDTGAPVLPAPLSPQSEREAAGEPIFGLGPQVSNMIPESSMGMGKDTPAPIDTQDVGPTISSVGPTSTTSQLAGLQPIEPRAAQDVSPTISSVGPASTTSQLAGLQPKESRDPPAIVTQNLQQRKFQPETATTSPRNLPALVTQSQQEAKVDPEASANPEAVREKEEVLSELKGRIPETPAISDAPGLPSVSRTFSNGGMSGASAAGLAAAGTAAAGTTYAMANMVTDTGPTSPVSALPTSIQDSIFSMNKGATNAPLARAATSELRGTPTRGVGSESLIPQQTTLGGPVRIPADTDKVLSSVNPVPKIVTTSQSEARAEPEASASPRAVQEKSEYENELLSKVPESEATGEPAPTITAATSATAPTGASKAVSGLNAPADSQAQSSAAASDRLAPETKTPADSRDVSPMSRSPTSGQEQPTVTTGVGSSKTATESKPAGAPVGTPRRPNAGSDNSAKRGSFIDRLKSTPESQKPSESSSSSSKQQKHRSFFGRLKDKLK